MYRIYTHKIMQEQIVNLSLAKELGLLEEEYKRILEILGRTPTYTELGMYSVMWSEHCSYKNSIAELKKLPRNGKNILISAGEENAGLVDIGDGLGCAFKIESHNHPSAIEPYQGAATGVGGINRDIFTMGARPVAKLNSLRFGNLTNERKKWQLRGVVKGIGDNVNASGEDIGKQDMGAAGIICSTSEMSAKGKHGMVVHLDQVPTRQKGMLPWEILLSESQERMLVVAKKGREREVEKIFEKWD